MVIKLTKLGIGKSNFAKCHFQGMIRIKHETENLTFLLSICLKNSQDFFQNQDFFLKKQEILPKSGKLLFKNEKSRDLAALIHQMLPFLKNVRSSEIVPQVRVGYADEESFKKLKMMILTF